MGDRNEAFLTNISVIDFTHGGERLFSLELTIENPISHAEGRTAPASGRPAQHTNGVSDVRVAAFESFVKKEKAQIERNAREKGLMPWRVDEARLNELKGEAEKLETEIDALLAKFGGDEKDPVALKKQLAELNALRERWKNPYSDGELMDEIRNAWRAREGADVPEGAAASVAELPSERLFREYAAREWRSERTDYSFTDDDGKLHNLSRAYATDAQGNRLGQNVYITTPNGNLDWYRFPQDKKTQGLLAKHGVKDLPIRLVVGKQESHEH